MRRTLVGVRYVWLPHALYSHVAHTRLARCYVACRWHQSFADKVVKIPSPQPFWLDVGFIRLCLTCTYTHITIKYGLYRFSMVFS